MTIYFYTTGDKYGCFSNFSPHGFEVDGVWWRTSEHFFQAQKFAGTPHAEAVRQVKTPKDAARMGRSALCAARMLRKRSSASLSRSLPLRLDWNSVKDDIMRRGVLRKFQTHADIREVLLSTGNELIVENSPIDYYWGCGADGSGKNMLGQILMEVRAILRDSKSGDREYEPQ